MSHHHFYERYPDTRSLYRNRFANCFPHSIVRKRYGTNLVVLLHTCLNSGLNTNSFPQTQLAASASRFDTRYLCVVRVVSAENHHRNRQRFSSLDIGQGGKRKPTPHLHRTFDTLKRWKYEILIFLLN